MSYNDDNEDEEDDDDFEQPFDFSEFFNNPNKFFKSKQFKKIFKQLFENIMKNLPSEFQNLSPEEIRREFMRNKEKFGPIIYGFNLNIGPDGKPIIDSFGNIRTKPYSGGSRVEKTREPLVEINEQPDQIIIIAEMPGIMRDEIELKATSRSLTISATSPTAGRNYYKEIELPSAINSDYAKARYSNGILEVKLKKIDEKQTNIKID
ncbi:MAG: archaeal heat shock protein Hsp20 [Candidatus Hodarchaeota archaeon]